MISVREALDLVLRDLSQLGNEQVPLPQALGRVLAAPVRATRDIPPFRNSAMDGYAVRAIDTTRISTLLKFSVFAVAMSMAICVITVGSQPSSVRRISDIDRAKKGLPAG